jgi:hypothetical protein
MGIAELISTDLFAICVVDLPGCEHLLQVSTLGMDTFLVLKMCLALAHFTGMVPGTSWATAGIMGICLCFALIGWGLQLWMYMSNIFSMHATFQAC